MILGTQKTWSKDDVRAKFRYKIPPLLTEPSQAFILGLEHCAPNVTDLRLRRPHTTPEGRVRRNTDSHPRSLFYSTLTRYTLRCTSLTFDDCIDIREFLSAFDDEELLDQQYPHWPHLERLHIRNSFLMRSPYMRVQTRAQAMHQVDRLLMLVGRALRYMPLVTSIKIKLYVFSEARLEQTRVQYSAWTGGANVKFTGRIPLSSVIDIWKDSVRSARGSELQVG